MRNNREHKRHALVMLLALGSLIACTISFPTFLGVGSAETAAPSWTFTRSINTAPALRANGKIAFTSDRDGNPEIYVMDPDGTNQTRITNNNIVDDQPMWSPDGMKLAFVSQRPTGDFAILQMNADGTNRVEITYLTSYVYEPPYGAIGYSIVGRPTVHNFQRVPITFWYRLDRQQRRLRSIDAEH